MVFSPAVQRCRNPLLSFIFIATPIIRCSMARAKFRS
jgi:hypothetical protein